MMDQVARHLVPRHLMQAFVEDAPSGAPSDTPKWTMSENPGAVAVFAFTIAAFVLLNLSINYTLDIVTSLAMIESPRTTYLVADEKSAEHDPEVLIIKEAPLTNRIRRTVRHLVSRGGAQARWRGISVAIAYSIAQYFLNNLLFSLFNLFHIDLRYDSFNAVAAVIHTLCGVGAQLLLARLSMTWTHVVISDPSPLRWFRRVPSMKTWKKIALPTAVRAFCWQLTCYLPASLFMAMGFSDSGLIQAEPKAAALKLCAIALIALMTFVGLYIPSEVTLTRMQASLLPESDESIVNFDRTFNGRVVPEILGGSGCVGFMDAWRSFDGSARLRLLKLYAKVALINVALHAFFALVLAGEFWAFSKHAKKE